MRPAVPPRSALQTGVVGAGPLPTTIFLTPIFLTENPGQRTGLGSEKFGPEKWGWRLVKWTPLFKPLGALFKLVFSEAAPVLVLCSSRRA